MSTAGAALADHFARTWQMWRDEIAAVPDNEWRSGDVDYLIPARHAYHVAEAVMYYFAESDEPFKWGGRFDGDWEGMPAEKLPSKEDALAYMAEAEALLAEWLQSRSDEKLLEGPKGFEHTGGSVLGRALYVMRHNQHHLGVLHNELRRRGVERARWK